MEREENKQTNTHKYKFKIIKTLIPFSQSHFINELYYSFPTGLTNAKSKANAKQNRSDEKLSSRTNGMQC